ncbi:beta-hexosaminidase [Aquipluma nitroreducens]|uniref:beta-N-acetylhexosaminidase n=1 Tax=Aquipluma nitroreducens TaxID=2010828 RepID=A0A5K7SF46_9BACT|nr:family 20 glycosylhydrolase [Aquipluma nitroreducens]BBE20173.1 beta-hexosaminidase [Aquipluma nitroreducens]
MKSRSVIFKLWKFTVVAVSFFFLLQNLHGRTNNVDVPALIPMPQQIFRNNQSFKIDGNKTRIIQRIVSSLPNVPINQDEAYILKINADSLVLQAKTQKGLFRGQQTISQLTFTKVGKQFVAGCTITDWPAFQIRGFMQDVGRNFMSVALLKEQIDVMAAYKFNVFHLHLTDNPGWRLESKKYPELHVASSMSRRPGMYYSQEDFLELVNYCNDRFITLVPEFDIPGHCEAFRRAFAIDSMSDQRVKPILLDLIDELCNLVPKEKMPYLHLGTDEVWSKHERPADGLLEAVVERVKSHNREVIVWSPGQHIENDTTSITQLWSSAGKPKDGHRYIDSRLNYLNHLDPLAGVVQLYFDRICGAAHGDSMRLGGILCCWNDNNVNDEYDIIRQNPVYPGMLTYSETSWKGQSVDFGENYLAKLPYPENPLYKEFQNFEERLTEHRDRYFQDKPFPYVKQSEIVWKMIGPFESRGDLNQSFPVESSIRENYIIDGKKFSWTGSNYGGTIHIRHFFGFPSLFSEKQGTVYATTNIWSPKDQKVGCWIGFQDWSRSGGRRGGPFPQQGQWHTTNPKVWVNGEMINPPVWKNPGLAEKTEEIPFSDENYFSRKPTKINLKKGWNTVLLKVPQGGTSWKWMFTFVPVRIENNQVKEIEGLRFSVNK